MFISTDEAHADWINQRNITGIENIDDMQFDSSLTNQSNILILKGRAEIWDYIHESRVSLISGGSSFSISPNGELIAFGHSGYQTGIVLTIVDRSSLETVSSYELGDFSSIIAVDWISDDLLAVGQSSNNISVLAQSTGNVVYSHKYFKGNPLKKIHASPDGQFIGAIFKGGIVVIDWRNDTEYLNISGNMPFQLSWSYDSEYLAISYGVSDSKVISIDNLETVWVGVRGDAIEFAPDRNSFLLGTNGNRSIRIYDLERGNFEFLYRFNEIQILKLRWNHNGTIFAVAFDTQIIRFFFNSSFHPNLVPPSVKITSPEDGTDVFGLTQILGTAEHPFGIQFVMVRIDENPWQLAKGTNFWSISLNLSHYKMGNHIITALSSTGFKTSPFDQISVNVIGSTDNVSKPMINITYPEDHTMIRDSVLIKGHSWGELAINYVEISLDNNAWQMALGTYNWRYYLDIDILEGGNHSIRARSVDAIHISEVAHIQITISRYVNEPPTLSLKTPEPSSVISEIVVFEGTATDTDGIQSVQYSLQNVSSTWITTNGLSDWTFSINTNLLSNGPITIQIRAFDTQFSSSIHEFHYSVFNTVKYVGINILYPEYNKKTVYGNIVVRGTFENHQILARAMFNLMDYGKELSSDDSNWSFEINTNKFPNGNYTILIIAVSTYNLLSYKELIIDIQNVYQAPRVVISSPENHSVFEDNFHIEGSAEDDLMIVVIQYSVDNGEWINCSGTNQWSCYFDIGNLNPGFHQFSIRGYNGYVYSKPDTLTLEIEKEESDLQGDVNIYLLLISILTVVIISMILILLRERKKS